MAKLDSFCQENGVEQIPLDMVETSDIYMCTHQGFTEINVRVWLTDHSKGSKSNHMDMLLEKKRLYETFWLSPVKMPLSSDFLNQCFISIMCRREITISVVFWKYSSSSIVYGNLGWWLARWRTGLHVLSAALAVKSNQKTSLLFALHDKNVGANVRWHWVGGGEGVYIPTVSI